MSILQCCHGSDVGWCCSSMQVLLGHVCAGILTLDCVSLTQACIFIESTLSCLSLFFPVKRPFLLHAFVCDMRYYLWSCEASVRLVTFPLCWFCRTRLNQRPYSRSRRVCRKRLSGSKKTLPPTPSTLACSLIYILTIIYLFAALQGQYQKKKLHFAEL